MARFGIELIAKKDGYPSQNDFALSIPMARFGIEGLMQKGWSVQKTTLSSPHGSFRHRICSEKGRVPFSKRLCPVPEGDRLRRWRL